MQNLLGKQQRLMVLPLLEHKINSLIFWLEKKPKLKTKELVLAHKRPLPRLPHSVTSNYAFVINLRV